MLFSSGNFELVRIQLKPGEAIDPHRMPMEVLFLVLEGEGNLITENNPVRGEAGDLLGIPAGKIRGWRNDGGSDLVILVMKLMK
jgi:quercetin dioxygenase-like cupin family protein